jgi:hypothetical protein
MDCFQLVVLVMTTMLSVQNLSFCEEPSTGGLEVSAAVKLPLDARNPCIVMRFHNSGKEVIKLMLPKGKDEFELFQGLSVEFDGAAAQTRASASELREANPAFSVLKQLDPGDSYEFVVNVNDIFVVPANWRKAAITPKPAWGGSIPCVCAAAVVEAASKTEKR